MKSSKKAVCCFFVVLYTVILNTVLTHYELFVKNICIGWRMMKNTFSFSILSRNNNSSGWVFGGASHLHFAQHFWKKTLYPSFFHSFEFRWRIFLNRIDREGLLSNVVKRCVCVLTSGHKKLLPYKTKTFLICDCDPLKSLCLIFW